MRMRFRRRQPLFGTAKSTELSPPAADKPLDFVELFDAWRPPPGCGQSRRGVRRGWVGRGL